MSNHHYIRFRLNLGYDQFLAVYQGIAKTVVARADDGRNISFPAGNIQRYLSKNGIQGYFELELTEKNKFIAIKKLD
ncbi:DUF2835 domain-containing protein [Methylomonas sp. AM2-LC]|uniref:DUF2835 domain-containing protein n=1 Tax=Methylomonas sp. AM2-LC TaxID=3153301 RepID=UPI0032633DEE